MATTVLVIDDLKSVRKTVAAMLNLNRGFSILEAEDGLEGLELARKHKPDLIISDVIMDRMNGFMMVESLLDDPETAIIPVIMMTDKAQSAGAWKGHVTIEYLEKGFTVDSLLAVVDKVMKGSRQK